MKFHGYLREELQHEIGYRTVVRRLHDRNFRLKVPQPWPDRQDEAQRQLFLERLRAYLQDESLDIRYLDGALKATPAPGGAGPRKGRKFECLITASICA